MAKATNPENKNTDNETPITTKAGEPIDEIGTLTYARAVQRFGKDRALEVLRKVAELGGHGFFEDDQFKSPLFGGLQMPDPDKVEVPREEDFAHLPEASFHFAAAMEEHEKAKNNASDNRKKINEFYKSLKS